MESISVYSNFLQKIHNTKIGQDGWKSCSAVRFLLTDAVAVRKSKDAFDLIEGNVLLNLNHVSIKLWG